jgi:hypothetical protein
VAANGWQVYLNYSNGGTCDYWGETALVIPASVASGEAYQHGQVFRHQPIYLQAGQAGTMEGQKFVAHGGLGTAKHYVVGAASGNITLGGANGKAIEFFDESGNSIGVLPLQSYTVNP